jgi:hypothetical protein
MRKAGFLCRCVVNAQIRLRVRSLASFARTPFGGMTQAEIRHDSQVSDVDEPVASQERPKLPKERANSRDPSLSVDSRTRTSCLLTSDQPCFQRLRV